MNTYLPPLKPITTPWMHSIMEDFKLQEAVLETYNSPVNLHHLGAFQDNIAEYKSILDTYGFKYQLFFARKANKFKNLIPAAVEVGIGIDTASLPELQQCLDLDVNPKQLISTAAIKNKALLELAVRNKVLLIIDNKDELDQVRAIAKSLNQTAKIGIRISGFKHQEVKLFSRFGFDVDAVIPFLETYFKNPDTHKRLSVEGFHFHLDGYSTAQRGEAIHQTLDIIAKLKHVNFPISFIDMGGGILMNYLQSQQEWNRFKDTLKQAVLEKHDPITYNNDGLGYRNRDGHLEGDLATYPYFNENSKASFLKEILETTNTENKTVAQRLKQKGIELRLEPGRSLLNQVGITLARVAHRKVDARGNHLIGLEMNMSQLKSSSADFLLDPFISYKNPNPDSEAVPVYFTGAYCLERDVLLKRKISVPQLPEIGDTVLFVNTAGYMMHFFETEAHLFERAKNLSLTNYPKTFSMDDIEEEL